MVFGAWVEKEESVASSLYSFEVVRAWLLLYAEEAGKGREEED